MEEWEQLLKANGYTVADVEAAFGRIEEHLCARGSANDINMNM